MTVRHGADYAVFSDAEIDAWYRDSRNLMVIEMVYLGYFGLGHNVNWRWLKENGYWPDRYPNQFSYTPAQFRGILERGDVDFETLVADQT